LKTTLTGADTVTKGRKAERHLTLTGDAYSFLRSMRKSRRGYYRCLDNRVGESKLKRLLGRWQKRWTNHLHEGRSGRNKELHSTRLRMTKLQDTEKVRAMVFTERRGNSLGFDEDIDGSANSDGSREGGWSGEAS